MKLVYFILLPVLMVYSSCRYVNGQRIRGNGNVKTEERSPGTFKSVSSHGSFNLYVSSGNPSVKVEAEDNLLPYIETYVDGSELKIREKDNYWLRPSREVKIFVSLPDFESIRSFGSGDILSESKISNTSHLDLEVDGSGNIKMEVDAPQIEAATKGSGDISLKGSAQSWEGEIMGSGSIKAADLHSGSASIKIYGSGNADVYADSKLDVHVAGSGDVNYKGNAQVSSSIAGSGRVKKID